MSSLVSIIAGEKLKIVNQLLLPHTLQYLEIATVQDAHDAIKTMKIRGAPAIASLAALSISYHLSDALDADLPPYFASPKTFVEHINLLLAHLITARPTAINLSAAMHRLKAILQSGLVSGKDVMTMAKALVSEGMLIADEDIGKNKEMSQKGVQWLLNYIGHDPNAKLNILTVCNTGSLATSGYGTALGLITYLHESGNLDKAYYTQSAPYHQGSRLTALELQTLQIPSVMLCDTMVGSLFQNHRIHAVVVGADRIARNGDTANKIGTYNAAVLAARHQVPFIVVAPVSTVDLNIENGSKIPIEHRPSLEACIVRGALYPDSENGGQATVLLTPRGLNGIYNPSFDVTPAELITAIATENGVVVKEGEETFNLTEIAVAHYPP